MSIKETVSPEQWQALFNTPSAACVYVSLANGSGFEIFKEMFSASRFIKNLPRQNKGSGYGQMVDDFLAEIKGMSLKDARTYGKQYQSKDLAGILAEAKQIVAEGAAVASALPGGDGYKCWILDMARNLAMTKTGGFMGFGGVSVIDDKEQAALAELKAILGV